MIPDLLKDMIITPQQYARPMKIKRVTTQDSSTNTIEEEGLEIVRAEDEPKSEKWRFNDETSDEDEEDEIHEVNVATYELRSKSGDTKRREVKPLKWPVLTKWKIALSEVQDATRESHTGKILEDGQR